MERWATIQNREGLHFRPIMQLVDLGARFQASVVIHVDDREANAGSPMDLLMLVGTQGTKLRLVGEGEDAEAVLAAMVELIESGFGES